MPAIERDRQRNWASRTEDEDMRALVVYESMFGNTRDIALAIADGLGTSLPVEAIEVGEAPRELPADVALLVVGGPTHAHGMTTAKSRTDAAGRAGERLVSRGPGMREWLASVRPASAKTPAAAFDTRIKGPGLLWGSAAKAAVKALEAAGFRVAQPAHSFLVGGPAGSMFDRLAEGELDEARAWGASLGSSVAASMRG
jgi:hypothetical protein